MAKPSPPTDQNSFLAGIGHICLQWALLEQTVIAIIATAENIPLEKAYTRFGGLDMQPRLNMAIKLTREGRWPRHLTQPLVNIRRAIQQSGDNLGERRNLFVHGVHEETEVPGEFTLTMARWSPDKRQQTVSILDTVHLVARLRRLVLEAEGVFYGYGVWKFGPDYKEDRSQRVAETKALSRLVRAQNIKRALKLLWANLKP